MKSLFLVALLIASFCLEGLSLGSSVSSNSSQTSPGTLSFGKNDKGHIQTSNDVDESLKGNEGSKDLPKNNQGHVVLNEEKYNKPPSVSTATVANVPEAKSVGKEGVAPYPNGDHSNAIGVRGENGKGDDGLAGYKNLPSNSDLAANYLGVGLLFGGQPIARSFMFDVLLRFGFSRILNAYSPKPSFYFAFEIFAGLGVFSYGGGFNFPGLTAFSSSQGFALKPGIAIGGLKSIKFYAILGLENIVIAQSVASAVHGFLGIDVGFGLKYFVKKSMDFFAEFKVTPTVFSYGHAFYGGLWFDIPSIVSIAQVVRDGEPIFISFSVGFDFIL